MPVLVLVQPHGCGLTGYHCREGWRREPGRGQALPGLLQLGNLQFQVAVPSTEPKGVALAMVQGILAATHHQRENTTPPLHLGSCHLPHLQHLWCSLNPLGELVQFAMLEHVCSSLLFYIFLYFLFTFFWAGCLAGLASWFSWSIRPGTEAAGGGREERDPFCLGSPHIVGLHVMLVPIPLPSWVGDRLSAAAAVRLQVPSWARHRLTPGPPVFSYALQILSLTVWSECIVCAGACSTKSGVCGPWRAHGQILASTLLPVSLLTLPLVMVNKHWLWHTFPIDF